MAGKKKMGKAEEKGKRTRKRKTEDEIDLHDNKNGDVNKAEKSQEAASETQNNGRRTARNNKREKKNQELKEKEISNAQMGAIKSTIDEGDQIFEMEVDAEQDIFQQEGNVGKLHEIEEHEMETDSSEDDEGENENGYEETMQDNSVYESASNNNVIIDSGDEDCENYFEANTEKRRTSISREEKEEIVGEAYDKAMTQMKKCMREVIASSGLIETTQHLQDQLKKGGYQNTEEKGRTMTINIKNHAQTKSKGKQMINRISEKVPIRVDSEVTIYRNAVENGLNKRSSSSSEDEWFMDTDTSGEHMSNDESIKGQEDTNDGVKSKAPAVAGEARKGIEPIIDKFISDHRPKPMPTATVTRDEPGINNQSQPQPLTSGWHRSREQQNDGNERRHDDRRMDTHNARAAEVIQEAEAAKARIFDLQGRSDELNLFGEKYGELNVRFDLVHSAMVDENYMLVAAHLEESLQGRIIKGEYVDFSRLIPRDRILEEEDETMQMIVKNG